MNEIQIQNQEMIKISETEINGVKVQTINARDLHSFLEVGRDFSTWIKSRLSTLGSIEGEDYLLTKTGEQLPSGTKYKIDYFILKLEQSNDYTDKHHCLRPKHDSHMFLHHCANLKHFYLQQTSRLQHNNFCSHLR